MADSKEFTCSVSQSTNLLSKSKQGNSKFNLAHLSEVFLDVPKEYHRWKAAPSRGNSLCPWRKCLCPSCKTVGLIHLPGRTPLWPSTTNELRGFQSTASDLKQTRVCDYVGEYSKCGNFPRVRTFRGFLLSCKHWKFYCRP